MGGHIVCVPAMPVSCAGGATDHRQTSSISTTSPAEYVGRDGMGWHAHLLDGPPDRGMLNICQLMRFRPERDISVC